MDELKINHEEPKEKRDMDRAAIARRRAMIKARRRKRQQMRIMVLGSLALIAVLVVILLVMGISALVKTIGGSDEKNPGPTEPTVEATTEPTPDPTESMLQVKLENPVIEDLDSLDNTTINWGYGKHYDDMNRPNDAVAFQAKYGEYNGYFVRDTIDEKIIYLTFDEGYEYGFTPSILDTLKATDTKVVFFVTMPFVKEHPDLVQRMIDEGHILANHSVNHPADGLPSETIEEQQAELMDLHNHVKDNFNYEMWMFRYPSGKFSEQSLAVVNNLNYKSMFWSFAHYDFDVENQPDEQETLQKCLDALHPGAIYLLHAVSETNTNILEDFINGAKEQGYRFELIPADEEW